MLRKRLLPIVALAALFHLSTAAAQDWPQWRGPDRDARAAGFEVPQSWPETLTQTWRITVGDGVATPALVGDRLYVFSRQEGNEVTRCLNAQSGEEIWRDQYEAQGATGPAAGFAGPRCSPTVAEGKVITLGVRGTLSCLDAQTGEVLWRNDEIQQAPRFFTSSSPIVVDGLCIAQLGGEDDGAVVAFDLDDGKQVWKWSDDGTAYASPVLLELDGQQTLVAETSGNVIGLSVADGQLLWQVPYEVEGRGYNAATPIAGEQAVYLTGSRRGTRLLQIGKQGEQYAATQLWSNMDNSVQYNTPVVKDNLVFGLSDRDILFCLNSQSGETLWASSLSESAAQPQGQQEPARGRRGGRGGGRGGGGGYGSIVDAGAVLLALTPASQLVVFEPSGDSFQQLASYKVSETRTYAYPVLSGNRIFIKDQNDLALWTLK